MKFLTKQETYQLHKAVYHQKAVRPIVSLAPNKHFQADLIDLSKLAYWNNNNTFILTIIDTFSKYAWAVPVKTKTGANVAKAIEPIITQNPPRVLQTDNGSEFISAEFKAVCEKAGVKQLFSRSYTPQSQGQIERFNRTLKKAIWSHFSQHQTKNYVNALQAILANYNSTVHTTTKARPDDIKDTTKGKVAEKARVGIQEAASGAVGYNKRHFREVINVGDKVRLAVKVVDVEARKVDSKKYKQQWTTKIYTVDRVYVPKSRFETRKIRVEGMDELIPIDSIQLVTEVDKRELDSDKYKGQRELHLAKLHKKT